MDWQNIRLSPVKLCITPWFLETTKLWRLTQFLEYGMPTHKEVFICNIVMGFYRAGL